MRQTRAQDGSGAGVSHEPRRVVVLTQGVPSFARASARIMVDLIHAGAASNVLDLSRTLVVVPGARAGRLVLHALLEEVRERSLLCDVPRIATVGHFIETAFAPVPGVTAASHLERVLAWERTLEEARHTHAALFLPQGLTPDAAAWRRIARSIVRLEDDLDAADHDLGHAALEVERRGADATRLRAIESMSKSASAKLQALGYGRPHDLRRACIDAGNVRYDWCVLLGTLDLAPLQRRAIDRMPAVLSVVAGRETTRDRFDVLGVATAAWEEVAIDIPEESVVTARTTRDAAELALRFIADNQQDVPDLACDEVAIGITSGPDDPLQTMELALTARDAGVEIHDAAGVALLSTPLGRVLADVGTYRRSRSLRDLAVLLRRPLVGRIVAETATSLGRDAVALLDVVRSLHLPATPDDCPDTIETQALRTITAAVDVWVDAICGRGGPTDVEGNRAQALRRMSDDSEHAALHAFEHIFASVEAIDPSLRGENEVLDLVLELAAATRLPAEPREQAVEAIGWLELLFEPARRIVVVGMTEGAVPGGSRGDGLLPESVRDVLGMSTRRRRSWRDAALLDALLARCERLQLIVPRVSSDGDPLIPSRFLLRLRGQDLARRVIRLTSDAPAQIGPSRWQRSPHAVSRFEVPQPDDSVRTLDVMSVTDFRQYLVSPMRFWLGRVERLDAMNDDPAEIPVPDLGTIMHATLRWFAEESGLTAIYDSDQIEEALQADFDRRAREHYGPRPLPAVRLQLTLLRRRLTPFAQWQARNAWEGWRIAKSEWPLPEHCVLQPKQGRPMRLKGRIDRIDRHESSGAIRIIDYKTSDAGKSPRESHRAGKRGEGAWRDLQLPLYIHGLRSSLDGADSDHDMDAGYVRLPADPRATGWVGAQFTSSEIDEAIDVAISVVERIRAGVFPMGDSLGPDDPFEGVLQRAVFGGSEALQRLLSDEGSDGDEESGE